MKYVVLFGVALVVGIVLAFLEVNEFFGYIISVVVIFGLGFYLFFFPLYFGKDITKIESYLLKYRKNPMFRLYYGMGNRIDGDVKEATEVLLRRFKQPGRQAMFKTLYALYEDDILRAKQDIADIQPLEYKNYYRAIVAVEEGKLEKAEELKGQIKKEWMKHALAAGIAKKTTNQDVYADQIQLAFEKTRGIQRYVFFKQFEEDLKPL